MDARDRIAADRPRRVRPTAPDCVAARGRLGHSYRQSGFSNGSPRRSVLARDPVTIGAADDASYPLGVIEVPRDGLAQSGREGFRRLPVEFPLDLGRVDGIAPVVPRSIGDMGDLLGI